MYTTDASQLAAQRAAMQNPAEFTILPEIISKEPLGPVVRHGDNQWGDIVQWTLNALIVAEELGVTSKNVDDMVKSSQQPGDPAPAGRRGQSRQEARSHRRLGGERDPLGGQLR